MITPEDLLGRRLAQVTTSWHHHREDEPSLLHMWLRLDGLGPVRFHTAGGDLPLMEIDEPHGPYDMDEYGRVTVEHDLPGFPLTGYAGERIVSVREVRQSYRHLDIPVGLALRFESGGVSVLDLGDDLVVTPDRRPDPVEGLIEGRFHGVPAGGPGSPGPTAPAGSGSS
ncbi:MULTISPECIES: hypothetical protein [unclassified Streptomyces]|uniref:hypothetical protein n=1 Tax=unclassified Streptomyces TaxID=2593676 RepID=UPI00344E71E2